MSESDWICGDNNHSVGSIGVVACLLNYKHNCHIYDMCCEKNKKLFGNYSIDVVKNYYSKYNGDYYSAVLSVLVSRWLEHDMGFYESAYFNDSIYYRHSLSLELGFQRHYFCEGKKCGYCDEEN